MRKLAYWTEEFTPSESLDILRELAYSHACEGGHIGKVIARLIHYERYRELCEFELDYSDSGLSPNQVRHCRQALAFFSKLEHLDIGVDKEKVAYKKFVESESLCRETNQIFRSLARGDFQFPPRVEGWLFLAQRKIARVLGPVPTFSDVGYRFGKGATTLTPRRQSNIRSKLSDGISCSTNLSVYAKALLCEMPAFCSVAADFFASDEDGWVAHVPLSLMEGILSFVPKNAKTYRGVVVEPVLNGMFQMGLGDRLSRRLRAFAGQDIRDQTRNQRLALEGSLLGQLATIDLSSASDTIASELVYHLLPVDWACFLAIGRTPSVRYSGKSILLEKFCSMGNGYTFPLETLIFWALTSAVCGEDTVSVYGDDIICPCSRYEDVCELLHACGFVPNRAKSFHTGPFRESCGKDYFRGIDVRPYYQKKWLSGQTLFVLHNYYARLCDWDRADAVRRYIHPSLVIEGPDGFGDGHLLSLNDQFMRRKPRHLRAGYAGYIFDTFTLRPRADNRPLLSGDEALPAYSTYVKEGGGEQPFCEEALLSISRALGVRFTDFRYAAEPIPTKDGVTAPSFPIGDEVSYRRCSIYTLG